MRRFAVVAVAGVLTIFSNQNIAVASPSPPQPNGGDDVGLLIAGSEFMATFGSIPTARLQTSETREGAVLLTFQQRWLDRRVRAVVGVSLDRLESIPASYLQTHLAQRQAFRERGFRDDANEVCAQPVSVLRRARPPAVGADDAIPIRLEAVCRTPKDAQWSTIFFVSEQLVNRGVQCGWTVRLETKSGESPSSYPVQDVCIPMQGRRGGNISVRILGRDEDG